MQNLLKKYEQQLRQLKALQHEAEQLRKQHTDKLEALEQGRLDALETLQDIQKLCQQEWDELPTEDKIKGILPKWQFVRDDIINRTRRM